MNSTNVAASPSSNTSVAPETEGVLPLPCPDAATLSDDDVHEAPPRQVFYGPDEDLLAELAKYEA